MRAISLVDNKKTCTRCKSLKDISEFYFSKNRNRKHKYLQRCKSCTSVVAKETAIKNKKPCPSCGKLIRKNSNYCILCVKKTKQYLEKQKLRVYKKTKNYCIDCSAEITLRSIRCVSCRSKGENNAQWKGGVTILKERIRDLFEYRQWRSDIFTRDNFLCKHCNQIGGKLQAHHNIPLNILLQKNKIITIQQAINCDELWNINNGITLCISCHNLLHQKEGYK